jgi:indolepyruvate ferredoxin oxidoreductase
MSGESFPACPEPQVPALGEPFGILVTGIGGTGVITIGQILAVAAHLEGKSASVLDMSGLAQKGGPVLSHVKFAASPDDLHSTRLGTGAADLVLGCDLVVTASGEALSRMCTSRTRVAVNTTTAPTADFVRNPDWTLPGAALLEEIREAAGAGNVEGIEAGRIATALMGDSIAANMFMLGYAWQKGWVPLAEASILKAIQMNAVAVDFNQKSLLWGRRAAFDAAQVDRLATPVEVMTMVRAFSRNLEEMMSRRVEFLTEYQNAAYAQRYRDLVEKVRKVETGKVGGTKLTEAVARYAFKLMAYKDEYEIARLYADRRFATKIERMFEGEYTLKFHLAPPLLNRPDPVTGIARKSEFGPWMMTGFRVLAKLKWLRGTAFDIFGRTEERRTERRLITEYETTVDELLRELSADNLKLAVQIASMPEDIRGFGHVKMRHLKKAKARETELLWKFRNPQASAKAA